MRQKWFTPSMNVWNTRHYKRLIKWGGAILFLSSLFLYFQVSFFTIGMISAPLFAPSAETPSAEAFEALSQSYFYLGKGKQAFAFTSRDGKWVLKFFNQKYFQPGIRSLFSEKERIKRAKRKQFYLESYPIAQKMLSDETGIVYLHFGVSSTPLPKASVTDWWGRRHVIDLNKAPFVLQKRANPLYPSFNELSQKELECAIGEFLSIVASRIDKKIADGDHHVEHNYGMLGKHIIQIDPGRLYFHEHLWEREHLDHEWWSATHQLRKWLKKNHPECLISFDRQIETSRKFRLKDQSLPDLFQGCDRCAHGESGCNSIIDHEDCPS
ncbi:MAG TPA: hypothetical protein VLE95_08750 [Chlamydiales bacterium]|nr:hypothetical protein [Chlamydiales bacterium]